MAASQALFQLSMRVLCVLLPPASRGPRAPASSRFCRPGRRLHTVVYEDVRAMKSPFRRRRRRRFPGASLLTESAVGDLPLGNRDQQLRASGGARWVSTAGAGSASPRTRCAISRGTDCGSCGAARFRGRGNVVARARHRGERRHLSADRHHPAATPGGSLS